MSDSEDKKAASCTSGCRNCSALQDCQAEPGGPTGWTLIAASACAFLLPLAAAVAGAIIAGGGRTRQFCGAFAGLAAGLVVGVIGSRLIARAPKENV